jgi:hypothetical protein
MHRPSSVKLWQMPALAALPMPPGVFMRLLPLDEHETSYLAADDSISSFCRVSIF